jgi:hypothetical protein
MAIKMSLSRPFENGQDGRRILTMRNQNRFTIVVVVV